MAGGGRGACPQFLICLLSLLIVAAKTNGLPCGGVLKGPSGYFESPGFSKRLPYPPNIDCAWLILLDPGQKVKVTFLHFDLEPHDLCGYDYIRFHDGDTPMHEVISKNRYCGKTLPGSKSSNWGDVGSLLTPFKLKMLMSSDGVTASSNAMFVWFHSDPQFTASGFRAVYHDVNDATSILNVYIPTFPPTFLTPLETSTVTSTLEGKQLRPVFPTSGTGEDSKDDKGLYHCWDGQVVPPLWLCDGISDCSQGEDESEAAGCHRFRESGRRKVTSRRLFKRSNSEFPGCGCQNGGTCAPSSEGRLTCKCPGDWTGKQCELRTNTGYRGACARKPCAHGGTCLEDGVTYRCLCPQGRHGRRCHLALQIAQQDVLYVNSAHTQLQLPGHVVSSSCGDSLRNACPDLRGALSKIKNNGTVVVVGTYHTDKPEVLNLNKTVTVIGRHQHLFVNWTVIGSSEQTSVIRFVNFTLGGSVALANVSCFINNAKMVGLQVQDFNELEHNKSEVMLSIDHSEVKDSMFLLNVTSVDRFHDVTLTLRNTELLNTSVSLKGTHLKVIMKRANFTDSPVAWTLVSGKEEPLSKSWSKYNRDEQMKNSSTENRKQDMAEVLVSQSNFCCLSSCENLLMIHANNTRYIYNVAIVHSYFAGPRALHRWPSRALVIDHVDAIGYMTIRNTSFHNNAAPTSGGAIRIYKHSGQLHVAIENCTFINNTAGDQDSWSNAYGGAIAALTPKTDSNCAHHRKTTIDVKNCNFIDNYAFKDADAVYTSVGIILSLTNSTFLMNRKPNNFSFTSQFLVVHDIVYFHNIILKIEKPIYREVFSYRPGKAHGFVNNITLQCPKGTVGETDYASLQQENGRAVFNSLRLACLSCKSSEFVLGSPELTLQTERERIVALSSESCAPCPAGHICHDGMLRVRTGHWSFKPNKTFLTLPCVDHCCNQPGGCDLHDQCANNRQGVLCSQCQPHLVENVFTTKCLSESDCGTAWTIAWLLAPCIFFILFFMFITEIQEGAEVIMERTFKSCLAGDYSLFLIYTLMIIDFAQVHHLLKSHLRIQTFHVVDTMLSYLHSIVSLEIFDLDIDSCFTFITQPALKVGLVLTCYCGIFLLLLLMYAISTLVWHIVSRCMAFPPLLSVSIHERYLGALTWVLLATYLPILHYALKLVYCINIPGGSTVLALDSNIECLRSWQYLVIVYLVTVSCPMFLAMGFIKLFVQRGLSSKFITSVLAFPLSAISVASVIQALPLTTNKTRRMNSYTDIEMRANKANHTREYATIFRTNSSPLRRLKESCDIAEDYDNTDQQSPLAAIFVTPYRMTSAATWWISLLYFRKLVLQLLLTFYHDPIPRDAIVATVCGLFLILHIKIKPFNNKLLTVISDFIVFMTVFTSFVNLARIFVSDVNNSIVYIASCIDSISSLIVIILFAFLVILAILLKLLKFVISWCKCKDESRSSPSPISV